MIVGAHLGAMKLYRESPVAPKCAPTGGVASGYASLASCGAVAAAGVWPRSYSASYSQASPSGDGGPQEIDSAPRSAAVTIARLRANRDRKSTRLNSSH